MFKSLVKVITIGLMLALYAAPSAWAADAAKKHHVVFHVTDNDDVRWNQALNNAANLQKNIGKENIDVEIVVNGPGLNMMKLESTVANRMSEALKNGVELIACGQTMKATNVTEKDLYPGIKVVPGGVIEIMTKQEAGWTYLKI